MRKDFSQSKKGNTYKIRPQWWLYLLAAVFVAYYLFQFYCVLFGPQEPGLRLRPGGAQDAVIITVFPDSVAEKAGLKSGDILLAFDGCTVKTSSDINVIVANLETRRTHKFEVEREGQHLQIQIRVGRAKSAERTPFIIWDVVSLFLLAIALLIAFKKPRDRLALLGALALASLSISMAWWVTLPWGGAAIWRSLPLPVGALLWLPRLASYLVGPIMLSFFTLFPRPLFRRPWPLAAAWLPSLSWVPVYLPYTFSMVYRPSQAFGHLLSHSWGGRILGIYFLGSLLAVAFNYYRLKNLNERRRLRVLFIGGAAGVFPGVLRLLIWQSKWPPGLFRWLASGVPDILTAAIFILFPMSFAYSILKHRLLDIRLIIRQGIQYALAKGALLAVVPVLALILVIDMLVHGNQPFIEILKMRGWIYLAIAALAAGLHSQRRRWRRAIDRRFFREQYDARRLLRELAVESARARNFVAATEAAVVRISETLHAEFVAILHKAASDRIFQCLASSPAERNLPPVAVESSLISRLRKTDRALELTLSESGRVESQLEETVVEWLQETMTLGRKSLEGVAEYDGDWSAGAGANLLVPIAMNAEGNEAILVLGGKRSEEPYTSEDRELLEAVAANLMLPLERESQATGSASSTFEECPVCGACWDTGSTCCGHDGASLTPVPLPRTLAGRYQLERRRGGGGMGTVYEARDKALGRRVAVKVMRQDFVHSAAAARRFEREARATAAFDHPNVVTVFDYGVEGGTHAFLVMELLEGSTLRDLLCTKNKLEPQLIIDIFRQVCLAVDIAHIHKLIHRDLKPENIYICASDEVGGLRVKILDFGVAKFLDPSEETGETGSLLITESGVLVGTPAYMSPEQLLGERPSMSWDLWALAVTAYEALTGALPFPVDDREKWRCSILAGTYVPLSQHLKDVPPRVEEFFARALEVDYNLRSGSASELFRQLQLALS